MTVLKPRRMPTPGACTVLELPAGRLPNARTNIGHRITIQEWSLAFAPSLDLAASA